MQTPKHSVLCSALLQTSLYSVLYSALYYTQTILRKLLGIPFYEVLSMQNGFGADARASCAPSFCVLAPWNSGLSWIWPVVCNTTKK